MPLNKLILTSIIVRDQDEALKFYTDTLGFIMKHDFMIPGGQGERWLTIAPLNQKELEIRLRKPRASENELILREMSRTIGRGSSWTFSTDDCVKTHEELSNKGVKFISRPSKSVNGVEAVFEDLDGNRFTILEVPK